MSLTIMSIPIEKLVPNIDKPRKELENDKVKLIDLALNIAENGLLQPIIVKEIEDGEYLIVKGERRYLACIYNNAEKMGCIVTDSDTPYIIGLIATMTRKDLKETEKAEALHKIRTQYEMSNIALAKNLGITEGYVRKLLKVHDLPDDVKQDINNGKTSAHEALKNQGKAKKESPDTSKDNSEIMTESFVNEQEDLMQVKKEKNLLVKAFKLLNLTDVQRNILFNNISEQRLLDEVKQTLSEK